MLNAIRRLSRCGSCIWIEELACSEHGMHDHRQFRATATAARLKPILSRSWRPHVGKLLPVELRVRMTDAAS